MSLTSKHYDSLTVDDKGVVTVPLVLARALSRTIGVKSRKRRIVYKSARKCLIMTLREYLV